jgi:hypothetical protein
VEVVETVELLVSFLAVVLEEALTAPTARLEQLILVVAAALAVDVLIPVLTRILMPTIARPFELLDRVVLDTW